MAIRMRIYRRTKIYAKAEVYDPDTMYFLQKMKENDDTQFLKASHKELLEFLSEGIFEFIHCSIVPERDTISLSVWAMKLKQGA